MQFAHYQKDDSLVINQYGIAEPNKDAAILSWQKLDLILLPLVAFDGMGHRLGTGGGYYDKTLMGKTPANKPYLFGIAYAEQESTSLPKEPWDIALDGVITENGVKIFSQFKK